MALSAILALGACLAAQGAGALDKRAIMETPAAREAGARTRGGAQPFGRIYRVTNLDDDGPGSLRHAIERTASRVIVFDVAGTIKLKSDLRIDNPWVTIAGQTAPAPGITLTRGSMRVRTSNVIIQHIAVRPGSAETAEVNVKRDGITIGPCNRCQVPTHGVLIDNVSVSWGIDENIGIWGEGMRQITVRSSLIAEALRHGGHPKGAHTAGLLIGSDMVGIEIVGNLFANNGFRNPAVNAGASVLIANNYIYNPHNRAIHINSLPKNTNWRTRAAVIGNVMVPGPDTRRDVPTVDLSERMRENAPDTVVFADGNVAEARGHRGLSAPADFGLRSETPLIPYNFDLLPPEQVPRTTLKFAGSRPAARNAVDRRIVDGVTSGQGRIIDNPIGLEELEAQPEVRVAAQVPDNPFSPSRIDGMLRIEAWLCLRHREVGGPRNAQCSQSLISLHDAMLSTGRARAPQTMQTR